MLALAVFFVLVEAVDFFVLLSRTLGVLFAAFVFSIAWAATWFCAFTEEADAVPSFKEFKSIVVVPS